MTKQSLWHAFTHASVLLFHCSLGKMKRCDELNRCKHDRTSSKRSHLPAVKLFRFLFVGINEEIDIVTGNRDEGIIIVV